MCSMINKDKFKYREEDKMHYDEKSKALLLLGLDEEWSILLYALIVQSA